MNKTKSRAIANASKKSDGIARVHGMNNVQAEELVEYANKKGN